MSYLQLAREVVEREQERVETKIRLVTPMSDARRQSLEDVMTVILLDARDRIVAGHQRRQYRPNEEARQAEDTINDIFRQVRDGDACLEEFRTAVERWTGLCLNLRS